MVLFRSRGLSALCSALALSACTVKPEAIDASVARSAALADQASLYADQAPLSGPLTFDAAFERALAYNIDHRVKLMEEALSLGQLEIDKFDQLPELVASADATYRTRSSASKSKNLSTGFSDDYSVSSDKFSLTADLTLSWNILDFGISYFTAKQNADRSLIAKERRRQAVAKINQELRSAFWRALAAQRLEERVEEVIVTAENELAQALALEKERLRDPVDLLRQRKALLENIRQLELINQELDSAKADFAQLINLRPGSEFILDDPQELQPPIWETPIDVMEIQVLTQHPELHEQTYLARIAAAETRKELLRVFPNLNIFAGLNASDNQYLSHREWGRIGSYLSWNLINLISAPTRQSFAEASETVIETRRMARQMALLAQLHIALQDFRHSNRLFDRAKKLFEVEQKLATHAENQRKAGTRSRLEAITSQTGAIAAELQTMQAYASVQAAYGRLVSMVSDVPEMNTNPGVSFADFENQGAIWMY